MMDKLSTRSSILYLTFIKKYPTRSLFSGTEQKHHINLLLIWDGSTSHYVCVTDFSRLVSSQMSKHQHTGHFCYFCLQKFSRVDVLEKHSLRCKANRRQHERYPKSDPERQDDQCYFKNPEYEVPRPFVIYADFETILKTVEGPEQRPEVKYTRILAQKIRL